MKHYWTARCFLSHCKNRLATLSREALQSPLQSCFLVFSLLVFASSFFYPSWTTVSPLISSSITGPRRYRMMYCLLSGNQNSRHMACSWRSKGGSNQSRVQIITSRVLIITVCWPRNCLPEGHSLTTVSARGLGWRSA